MGSITFIERLSVTPSAERLAWAAKMRDHYIARVTELLTKVPPGMQARARFYRRTIKGFQGL